MVLIYPGCIAAQLDTVLETIGGFSMPSFLLQQLSSVLAVNGQEKVA
jgi:hypothetical protein